VSGAQGIAPASYLEHADYRSLPKKCWLTICIMLMTSSVYMGSSIWR